MLLNYFLSAAPVHVTGVNWESVGAILSPIVSAICLAIAILWRRGDKTKEEITQAINNLAEVLLAKLETKEKVASLAERVAKVEASQNAPRPGP